jgi:opacity protein-like surface antigen
MKNILGLSAVLLILSTLSTAALAEPPFYVGGSIGQSYVEEDDVLPGEDFDDEDFGFKVFAGYRFHKNFAVELDYLDYGDPDDNILGIDVEIEDLYAVALYGVGILPLSDQFELFVKLGGAYWDGKAKAKFMGLSASSDESGTELAYGLGASYAFTDKFAARVEYEEIDVDSDDLDKLGLFTIGGEWRF